MSKKNAMIEGYFGKTISNDKHKYQMKGSR